MKKFIFNQVPCLQSVTLLKIKSFNRYFLKVFFIDMISKLFSYNKFTYLPTYLPTHLPTYLPTYLSTCLPAYLPTYLPAGWPTAWPTGRLADRPTDSLTDRPTDRPTDWLTDRPIDWPVNQSIYPSICKHTFIYIYTFVLSQLVPLLTEAWKRRTCCYLKNIYGPL